MIRSKIRRQSLLVLGIVVSLLVASSYENRTRAEENSHPGGAIVEIPQHQLMEIQAELEYLRRRDAEHREWETRLEDYLRSDTDSPAGSGWGEDFVAESLAGADRRVDSASYCQVCSRCGGCCAGQCPIQPAPCIDCPRASTLNPYYNVNVFGTLTMDMLFNARRPMAPGTPFFLAPGPVGGRDQQTFDLHARQSTLGAALVGPHIGSWQTGGMVLVCFYNDNLIADKYGVLPLQAYGEARNEDWRIAAGLQFDVFNPLVPTILPFSAILGSGNSGNAFRGQVRLERFIIPSSNVQWTLQTALSEPIPTSISPTFEISEDNGWPNVESRIALSLGPLQGAGPTAVRPIEFGLSSVVGQIRTTPVAPAPQVVADVWGVGSDVRCRLSEMFGFGAEFYSGQGLGTYNGAILQTVDTDTFESIRSTGGWCDFYVYLTPRIHNHWGYGIDDPLDRDVSADPADLGRIRNETYFTNLLFDVNPTLRLGMEFSYRETTYVGAVPDNEGAGYQMQCRWAF